MKRILLDTCALIWWLNGSSQLGSVAKEYIANANNDIYVSAASIWEMSIKRQQGKLDAPVNLEEIIENLGFNPLAISLFHSEQAGNLPLHHKDPFDRMLIAQAQAEGLQIITQDKQFDSYGVKIIHASK